MQLRKSFLTVQAVQNTPSLFTRLHVQVDKKKLKYLHSQLL